MLMLVLWTDVQPFSDTSSQHHPPMNLVGYRWIMNDVFDRLHRGDIKGTWVNIFSNR